MLPLRIGESVYADGGWVRNFPLAYAYREPAVQRIVGGRYRASAAGFAGSGLHSWHHRMSRLARVRVAREVTAELRDAIERQERGEPMHLIDTISRLSHIAVYRNSDLEVQLADERDRSLQAVHDVREQHAGHDRVLEPRPPARPSCSPRSTRRSPRPTSRSRPQPRRPTARRRSRHTRERPPRHHPPPGTWSDEDKLALVDHGRRLTEEALADWTERAAADPAQSGDLLQPARVG